MSPRSAPLRSSRTSTPDTVPCAPAIVRGSMTSAAAIRSLLSTMTHQLKLETKNEVHMSRCRQPCREAGPDLSVLDAEEERLGRPPVGVNGTNRVLHTSRVVSRVCPTDTAADAGNHGLHGLGIQLRPTRVVANGRAQGVRWRSDGGAPKFWAMAPPPKPRSSRPAYHSPRSSRCGAMTMCP